MTRQQVFDKINSNDGAIARMLINLRDRWQDEHEYEDINDYLLFIQKQLPEAYKIHKRPFGVTCKCSDGDMKVSVVIKGNYATIKAEFVK